MRILVALSGGIDSSVVAHVLKEQGHDLVGVRFTLWSDPLAPPLAQILPNKCCNAQTAARAKKVAEDLAIPYHILDLEEEFKREVVDPFLKGYEEGRTPNPCIHCNKTVKFGRLLEFMKEVGCEKLATGHYARVVMCRHFDYAQCDTSSSCHSERSRRMNTTMYKLLTAIDSSKDQSYYLYGLSQEQLSKVLFPLGDMYKRDVYDLAKKYGVPYEEITYRESQDLCFFPEKTPQEFLKRHAKMQEGAILNTKGENVGHHKGLPLYTLGQRRGLGIGGLKVPLEVIEKRMESNTLVVESQGKTTIDTVELQGLNWISPHYNLPLRGRERGAGKICLQVCVRSLSPRVHGTLTFSGDRGTCTFDEGQALQAPGQHCVFYQGDEVLGGGVIA